MNGNIANIRDYQRKAGPLPKEASWLQIYLMKSDKGFSDVCEYLITVDKGGSFVFAPVIVFEINAEDDSKTFEFYEYDAERDLWLHAATNAYQPGEFELNWPEADYVITHLVKKYAELGAVKLDCVSTSELTGSTTL